MDLIVYHLDHVNWLAVVFATLASFMLGGIWYSPLLFGNKWMKLVGLKKKDMEKGGSGKLMAMSGILSFVMVSGLATLMCALQLNNWAQGAVFGALAGVVFLAMSRGIHSLFNQKGGAELYLIDASYDVLFLTIAGGVIGAL